MPLQIRLRRDRDLDACVRALTDVHDLDGYPVRWPLDPVSWLTPPGTLVALVGELDGEVVAHGLIRAAGGTSAAETLAEASGQPVQEIVMVSRLFVAPSSRRRGIGRQLLDALATAAAANGVLAGLDVIAKDAAAIAMYEIAGWRRIATMPCDWTDAYQMHCYLAPHHPPSPRSS